MKNRVVAVLLAILLLLSCVPPVAVQAAYENTYVNTGDQRADIIGVALTQVGYQEESGGYTKYGDWFGRPTTDWCGFFISWCAEQAGVPTSVLRRTGIANPSSFGLPAYYNSSQYTPKPGDLFFTKSFSHAGIVYYVEGDSFYTLEGNTWYNGSPHGVMTRKRALSEHYFAVPNYNGSGASVTVPTNCDHNWKEDSVRQATCTANGNKTLVCSKCGGKKTETIAKLGHSFGEWELLDEDSHEKKCQRCQKTETESHKESSWLIDVAGHWKVCETCDGQLEVEPHAYQGECGAKCTVCGYANQAGHNYGPWQTDENGHWQVCSACQKATEVQVHYYGTECGEKCIDCGFTRITTHSYQQESNDIYHWLVCSVCQKMEEKEIHVPGDKPTEESAQYCTVCLWELAPALEHVHVFTYTSDQINHWGSCACGEIIEPETHAWSMELGKCRLCGAESLPIEEKTNYDFVWYILCGVAFAGILTTTIVALCKLKKKKDRIRS